MVGVAGPTDRAAISDRFLGLQYLARIVYSMDMDWIYTQPPAGAASLAAPAPLPTWGHEGGPMVRLQSRDASDAEISTYIGQGEVSLSELYVAYSAFLTSTPTRLTLVDLSSARLPPIAFRTIHSLATRVAQLGRRRRRGGRSAIVCGREPDFGLARVFVSLVSAAGDPVRFAVFGRLNLAKAWLQGESVDSCVSVRATPS